MNLLIYENAKDEENYYDAQTNPYAPKLFAFGCPVALMSLSRNILIPYLFLRQLGFH
jgi:hypothetical protein